MNSDKFDRVVLDLLYGELDELTTADALTELKLVQERRNLQGELESKSAAVD